MIGFYRFEIFILCVIFKSDILLIFKISYFYFIIKFQNLNYHEKLLMIIVHQ